MSDLPESEAREGQSKCLPLLHVWGIERGYRIKGGSLKAQWFRGVPDAFIGSAEVAGGPPPEKVCGRCGKRKPLRWGFGLR